MERQKSARLEVCYENGDNLVMGFRWCFQRRHSLILYKTASTILKSIKAGNVRKRSYSIYSFFNLVKSSTKKNGRLQVISKSVEWCNRFPVFFLNSSYIIVSLEWISECESQNRYKAWNVVISAAMLRDWRTVLVGSVTMKWY